MENNQLLKGSIIKALFVCIELIALAVMSIICFFFNDGTGMWGYWGAIAIVYVTFSPIIIYVTASAIFSFRNLSIVLTKHHTAESIEKYHKLSRKYFIWGIITGGIYGSLLVPIFLLENIFLFKGYTQELERIKDTDLYLKNHPPILTVNELEKRQMKNKHFLLIFSGIIVLIALTFNLQYLLGEITNMFGLSCAAFFISTFCLFDYKNALKPMSRVGFTRNSTKRYYQSRGELPKYQNICKILFLITISFGTITLTTGIGELLIYYGWL